MGILPQAIQFMLMAAPLPLFKKKPEPQSDKHVEYCRKCRYFEDYEAGEDDGGMCRRYPPAHDGLQRSRYPNVDYWDWCGEFKPSEGSKEE